MGRLGQGTQAAVYKAEQISTGRIVAVKLIPRPLSRGDSTVAQREFQSLARLQDHPNVVGVLDLVPMPGHLCLVLTWCEHGAVQPNLALATVMEYGVLLCGALVTAAAHGIFHGDIKPANVLVDALRKPRLADYGVAAIPGMEGSGLTPDFAPPERVRCGVLDELAEQFSLAKTLLRLCDPRAIEQDPELSSVLCRACAVVREQRYPSLMDFAFALQDCEARGGGTPTKPTVPAGPQHSGTIGERTIPFGAPKAKYERRNESASAARRC